MKSILAALKVPLAAIGLLLLAIGLMELLRFPQSMQNAVQSAFGPAVVVALAGWFLMRLVTIQRDKKREETNRQRLEELCIQAAECAMRTASDLINWRIHSPASAIPSSFSDWMGTLGKLRLIASANLLRAALDLHQRLQTLVTETELGVAHREVLNQMRDQDMFRASKLPPESSDDHEYLVGRAARIHDHSRHLLDRRATEFVSPILFEEQLILLSALRKELGADAGNEYFDKRLVELATAAREMQLATEADIRALVAPPAKPVRR